MAPSSKRKPNRPWQEIAKEAQEYRDASLATFAQDFPTTITSDKFSDLQNDSTNVPAVVFGEQNLKITESLPEELVKLLANGELRAVDVTIAFLRRAALAQKLVRKLKLFNPYQFD
jgi:acyl-homoserine lactone acylase PvdQ